MNLICETLVYAKKKLLPLQKISGISAKQSSELVVLRSICIIFALCKRKSEARTVIRIHEWDKIFCGGQ